MAIILDILLALALIGLVLCFGSDAWRNLGAFDVFPFWRVSRRTRRWISFVAGVAPLAIILPLFAVTMVILGERNPWMLVAVGIPAVLCALLGAHEYRSWAQRYLPRACPRCGVRFDDDGKTCGQCLNTILYGTALLIEVCFEGEVTIGPGELPALKVKAPASYQTLHQWLLQQISTSLPHMEEYGTDTFHYGARRIEDGKGLACRDAIIKFTRRSDDRLTLSVQRIVADSMVDFAALKRD